jgi:hypothetical protein
MGIVVVARRAASAAGRVTATSTSTFSRTRLVSKTVEAIVLLGSKAVL